MKTLTSAQKTAKGKSRYNKNKGNKLQREVAEALARKFSLFIEARPPTKPGDHDGVKYVEETDEADLRIRRSGEAGADIVLLSPRARRLVGNGMIPYWIECKNVKSIPKISVFSPEFFNGEVPKFFSDVYTQAVTAMRFQKHVDYLPMFFFHKNNQPIIVGSPFLVIKPSMLSYARIGRWGFIRLEEFLKVLG